MNAHILEAHQLVKRFGDFEAVKGIDVAIDRGESFGFLGPNGAGKTSTMRIGGIPAHIRGDLDLRPRPEDGRT
jgi:lipooligosaccharide transport system ATP-binding protein